MTIEHLVPQSQIGQGDFEEGIVGQLGNLILVSQDMNSRLNDKSFQEKKRILKGAGFPLSQDIADAEQWADAEIRTRTDTIAAQAYDKIWKI